MEKFLERLAWFAYPIAYPAWGIEIIYRKLTKKFWEFNTWSGSIYILVLVATALVLLLSSSLILQIISLYIFSALELVGLAVCAGVLFGNIGNYKTLLRRITKRASYSKRPRKEPIDASDIWVALVTFGYTAFYFAIVAYFIFGIDSNSYSGVQGQSPVEVLFNFFYFSYVSIASLGFTEIVPATLLTKLIYMVEISLGILFMLFIFSLFANNVMSKRIDDD